MRVMVVGASGFLGGHVMKKLMNLGVDVTGTARSARQAECIVQVELGSEASVREVTTTVNPDVILWCAKHTVPEEDERRLTEIGLRAMKASAKPDTRVVFVSTDGLLPGVIGNYDEGSPVVPIEGDSAVAIYTNAKLEAEQWLARNWPNHCIVRVGPIYGRSVTGSWDPRVTALLMDLKACKSLQRATNIYRSFIHVGDLADALCELADHPYHGLLHLGSARAWSYQEFAAQIAKAWGYPDSQVLGEAVPAEEIEARRIRADTSMDTTKARGLLQTVFRPIDETISKELSV